MEKKLTLTYVEKVKERTDSYSDCSRIFVGRTIVGFTTCCLAGAHSARSACISEDSKEAGAREKLYMFHMEGPKFCPNCGASIVLEKVTLDE